MVLDDGGDATHLLVKKYNSIFKVRSYAIATFRPQYQAKKGTSTRPSVHILANLPPFTPPPPLGLTLFNTETATILQL